MIKHIVVKSKVEVGEFIDYSITRFAEAGRER
jgi:hypothetical protein